jgi:hypothetical protein
MTRILRILRIFRILRIVMLLWILQRNSRQLFSDKEREVQPKVGEEDHEHKVRIRLEWHTYNTERLTTAKNHMQG